MIGDLIPNIVNDPKVVAETPKGSGEAAKGVFSSMLKNFEEEVTVTKNIENQLSEALQAEGENSKQDEPSEQIVTLLVGDVATTPIKTVRSDEAVLKDAEATTSDSELSINQDLETGENIVPAELENQQDVKLQISTEQSATNSDNVQLGSNTLISNETKVEGNASRITLPDSAGLTDQAADPKVSNLTSDESFISVSAEVGITKSKSDSDLNQLHDKALDMGQQGTADSVKKADLNTELDVLQITQTTLQSAETKLSGSDVARSGYDGQKEQNSTLLNRRLFAQQNESLKMLDKFNTSNANTQSDTVDVAKPMSFNAAQSSEILQAIQQNKAITKVSKEVKSHRFALSNSEQAETRLKLLVDSKRPELLTNRELPADLISTTTEIDFSEMYTSTGTLTSEQELMLKDLMMETSSGKEAKTSESNNFGFIRLNELTVLNTTARRSLVSSFGKVLQESLKSDQANQTEQWQKHTFKLEEGNSIDLTTRNIDGVLHIKLAASNPELNRLLQNMEQEIKDHLKEELNLELDLQFNQSNSENDSESLQKGILSEKAKLAAIQARELQTDESVKTNSGLNPSIRSFGYNQMEWTA